MSFLDSVIGVVDSEIGSAGGKQALLKAGLDLIQQHGGVQGIADKLRQGGLVSEVESWIGTGQNLPVSADTIQQVLGSGVVEQLAAKVGMDPAQVSQGLATVLPQLIDRATPNGTVGADHADLLQQGLGVLMGALGGSKPAA